MLCIFLPGIFTNGSIHFLQTAAYGWQIICFPKSTTPALLLAISHKEQSFDSNNGALCQSEKLRISLKQNKKVQQWYSFRWPNLKEENLGITAEIAETVKGMGKFAQNVLFVGNSVWGGEFFMDVVKTSDIDQI